MHAIRSIRHSEQLHCLPPIEELLPIFVIILLINVCRIPGLARNDAFIGVLQCSAGGHRLRVHGHSAELLLLSELPRQHPRRGSRDLGTHRRLHAGAEPGPAVGVAGGFLIDHGDQRVRERLLAGGDAVSCGACAQQARGVKQRYKLPSHWNCIY